MPLPNGTFLQLAIELLGLITNENSYQLNFEKIFLKICTTLISVLTFFVIMYI